MKTKSINNPAFNKDRFLLIKIVCSLSTITLFAKIFGFCEKLVIAKYFGTSDTADVYFAATGIILSIIWIIKELMYPSLLPVFIKSIKDSADSAGMLFRKIFISASIILFVIAACIGLFSKSLCGIYIAGYADAKKVQTADLLRTLTPAMFCIGLSMITYTILNAKKQYIKAACLDAALKLFIIIGLVLLVPYLGIYAFSLAMGIGGFICLLLQLYFIPERKYIFHSSKQSEYLKYYKDMLLLISPLFVGVVFSHISGLVDNLLASKLPSGHLSYLNYSKKMIDAALLIGPVALITVIYSELSHLAASNRKNEFKSLVIKSCRLLIFLSIPIACCLVVLKQPIIQILFQRGQFNIDSTIGTSRAFMIYSIGLTTFSLEALFVFTFFAMSNTKTPVKYGILCVFIDIGLAVILLKPFGYMGIAGAYVISKTLKVIILATVLNSKLKGLFDLHIAVLLAKITTVTSVVAISMKYLLSINNQNSLIDTFAFDIMLPSTGALLIFGLFSYILNIDEMKVVIALIRGRKAAMHTLYGEYK